MWPGRNNACSKGDVCVCFNCTFFQKPGCLICLSEKDTGLGIGHPVDPAKAAGGTEMQSTMKIGMRTIFRKEAGSMRDTETGTEKETGITEIGEIFPGCV